MRVAVVDIGTNSTRLLVADIVDGRVIEERVRESRVTRLGQGVDASGALAQEAMDRVSAVLSDFRVTVDAQGAEATTAVLTSAVRDASNGPAFTQHVRDAFGLDARTIPGAEEAALTFRGATSERGARDTDETVVIDIGGGSTELVVGRGGEVEFFTSVQVGVVRMTERRIRSDPPAPAELAALREDVRALLEAEVPTEVRSRVAAGIAVAGTATTSAAIELGLEPYDPARTHGHVLAATTLAALLERLVKLPDATRREVPGLHPDRAPTIVAGVALLVECLALFGLDAVEVSEHDILRGAALRLADAQAGP